MTNMISKKLYTKFLVAGSFMLGLGLTSCEDYLTVLPTAQITEEDFWKDKNDLDNVRSGAYKQMTSSGVTSRLLYWGELRADNFVQNDMTNTNTMFLMTGVLKPTDGMFKWADFYTGINYCNKVLEHGERMTQEGQEVDPSFRRGDWLPIRAEMTALRALYYFYLVKAYRNVPYVTKSISTDAEAFESRIAATQGVEILGDLIQQLEEVKMQAAENFTTKSDLKGRFTKRGIHALLADIYLWRGCMLKHSVAKGDSLFNDSTGERLVQKDLDKLSAECFENAIVNCDYVLNDIQKAYDLEVSKVPNFVLDFNQNESYPYMSFISSRNTTGVSDDIYDEVFRVKNSTYEGIFELQYDGVNTVNSAIGSYLGKYDGSGLKASMMKGAGTMCTDSYNPAKGFGKADVRMFETFAYDGKPGSQQLYHKNIVRQVVISNLQDMSEGAAFSAYRNNGSMDANWPVYRLADVMMIQAEAIARSVSTTAVAAKADCEKKISGLRMVRNIAAETDQVKLAEAYRLVNSFFIRSNPALVSSKETSVPAEFRNARLDVTYAVDRNSTDLLQLIYAERQREFVGEGKRWFDIVRQAEAINNNEEVFSSFISLPKTTTNRLKNLWSLYVPIHSDEMNVNGVDEGGSLQQNPVWDRYTVK